MTEVHFKLFIKCLTGISYQLSEPCSPFTKEFKEFPIPLIKQGLNSFSFDAFFSCFSYPKAYPNKKREYD
jgi:hypothetical protein